MCQGKGDRWKDTIHQGRDFEYPSEYKQLIPVNGKPNLFRTISILEEYGVGEYTVVAEPIMFSPEQLDVLGDNLYTLISPGNILEGTNQLLRMNPEDSFFLLGDVIFSRSLIHRILTRDVTSYTLWGRRGANEFTGKDAGEIFALSTCQMWTPLLADQLRFLREIECKLWGLYRSHLFAGDFVETEDWTDDIDSPDHYEQFYEKINELAKEDDE